MDRILRDRYERLDLEDESPSNRGLVGVHGLPILGPGDDGFGVALRLAAQRRRLALRQVHHLRLHDELRGSWGWGGTDQLQKCNSLSRTRARSVTHSVLRSLTL